VVVVIGDDADRLGVQAEDPPLDMDPVAVMEADPVADMVLGHVLQPAGFLEPQQTIDHHAVQGLQF